MAGRFLMIPAYFGALVLARVARLPPIVCVVVAGLLIVLSLQTKAPIVNNTVPTSKFVVLSSRNIVNQRASTWPQSSWLHEGSQLAAFEAISMDWHYTGTTCAIPMLVVGKSGIATGPDIHIVDFLGVTDPFLARLPPSNLTFPGHFGRKIPKGYMRSLETGDNLIVDPDVAALYDRVRTVTQGPLWSPTRWKYIVELLTGKWRRPVMDYHQNAELTSAVPGEYLLTSAIQQLMQGVNSGNDEEIESARRDLCLELWDY